MKILVNILIFVVCLFPKINIISIGDSMTGIRIEDIFILVICSLFFTYAVKNKMTFSSKSMNLIVKTFILYIAISSLSSIYGVVKGYIAPITSILFLVRKIEYFVFLYLGYNYAKYKNFDRYFDFIVIFHLSCCALQQLGVIGSFNRGEMLTTLTQGRISSTFNGAYELSAFLLILLPYYINNIINNNNKGKNIIFALIITYCVYISMSRTSLVVELVIIIIMIFKSHIIRKKKTLLKFIFIFMIVILPLVLFNFGKLDLSRFHTLKIDKITYIIDYTWKYKNFDKYVRTRDWYGDSPLSLNQIDALGYDGSLYQRMSHWMQLIDGWITSPIIGLGASISGGSADGNYLRILVESGVIGLIIWLYIIYLLYTSIKKSQDIPYLKYSLITIILGSIFIDLFEASKIMMFMWFLCGVCLGKKELRKKEEEND